MDFIWLGTRQQLAKLISASLPIKGQFVLPPDKVRELGMIIDGELSMHAQARNIVRRCFYQVLSVWRSLPTDTRCILAAPFIASRVDFCNALRYSVSTAVIHQPQMVLNDAVCLVVDRVPTIPVLEYWVLANTCRYWVVLVLAQYFLQ